MKRNAVVRKGLRDLAVTLQANDVTTVKTGSVE